MTADERDAALLEPGDHRRVVQVVDDLVAAREHGGRVELSPDRDARDPSRLRGDLTGPQRPFDGMHAKKEHSPPTSRSSTIATETPFSPSRPAITSPGAPAPITTTSNSPTSTSRYRTSVGHLRPAAAPPA